MVNIAFKILFLLIGTLIFVGEACPDGIAPCERPVSKEDQDKIIKVFNLKRELFRETFKISNMHDLVYDPDLAKIAGEVEYCKSQEHGRNDRITFVSVEEANDSFEKTKRQLEVFIRKVMDEQKIEKDFTKKRILSNPIQSEILNPLQTKIGCAYFKEDCSSNLESDGNVDYYKYYKGACVLGPLGTGYANEKSDSIESQRPEGKSWSDLSKEENSSGVGNVIAWWMIVFFCAFLMCV
ncbi:hypothetical protein CAEBREN_17523 [Caenorhabditis brenneri]|uniref:Uncharacterized protein n=1 Tax=Caenorhabditis brenneri TaxID=135651 RepID=G0NQ69_CAEBE|nr:hypothetical protein CAEBREN_17523 [Caenorhabditis brenneri]